MTEQEVQESPKATTRMMPAEGVLALAPRAAVVSPLPKFTKEQADVLKATLCPGYSDEELALFGAYCGRTGLDPFSRQIVTWKDRNGKVVIQTGIDGFRLIAERSGQYDGQDAPALEFTEEVRGEKKVKLLVSATVRVYRKTFSHPISATAYWDEYAPQTIVPGSSWDRMPSVMLSKCAEALALRKAFPNDLSGVYAPEEIQA